MDWDASGGGYLTIATSTLKNSTAFVGPGGAIAASIPEARARALWSWTTVRSMATTPRKRVALSVTTQVPHWFFNATTVSGNSALTTVNPADGAKLGQGGGIFPTTTPRLLEAASPPAARSPVTHHPTLVAASTPTAP